MATAVMPSLLHVVVVEDKARDRFRILHQLAETDVVSLTECTSVDGAAGLSEQVPVHACFLDARFGQDERDQLGELIDIVKQKWPKTIIVVVSAFPSPQILMQKHYVKRFIAKSDVEKDDTLLVRVLYEELEKADWESPKEFSETLASLREFVRANQARVLFETTGWVLDVRAQYVEVEILEEGSNEAVTRKKLLMPYTLLAAEGILGQDEEFRYSVFQKGGEITSKVTPLDAPAGPSVSLDRETVQMLGELEKAQEEAIKRRDEEDG